MELSTVRAVLLDMDGTLVDSDVAVDRAWRTWAGEYGVDPAAALAIAHGSPADRTVRRLLPDLDDAAVGLAAARQLELQYDDLGDVTATTGALELVRTMARLGLPWAVVTSADVRLAKARLGAAGIDAPVLVTVEDVPAGKPDPRGYLRAAELLDVRPERCLVVEDSEVGLQAGRAAGAPTAALKGLAGDLRIADLAQLAHLLGRERRKHWWQDALGYQVYLPSYADSDGDGWGDLPGVTARLDHLAGLGTDIVWLTPFYVSPMADHGYDIADYRHVDERYGGDAALTDLIAAAHERGMRVIGDLVVNHTSNQHPWFTAAASSKQDAHRDYYIWRDPAPDGGPPNNWLSHFGGPAWTLSEQTGQYYLHLFAPEQPDLNWRNPAVVAEVDAVMEHWLAAGLDGFRIDTAAYLVKHPDLPDNPALPADALLPVNGVTDDWRRQDHRYDIHQPDVLEIHARWRRVADRYGALLVGEVYELDPVKLAAYIDDERLPSSFWFGLVETGWDPDRITAMVTAAAMASPHLSWVLSNHDRPRAVSRFGGGGLGRRRSLALHTLMALLPGMAWLYQGEELGLADGTVPAGLGQDPLAAAQPEQSRDGARTPMPWSPGPGNGFGRGTAWLPAVDRPETDTVAGQDTLETSHLNAIRRLAKTRRRLTGHHLDGLEVVTADLPGLAAYRRDGVTVIANLDGERSREIDLPGQVVFDTDSVTEGRTGRMTLAPYQAVLVLGAQ